MREPALPHRGAGRRRRAARRAAVVVAAVAVAVPAFVAGRSVGRPAARPAAMPTAAAREAHDAARRDEVVRMLDGRYYRVVDRRIIERNPLNALPQVLHDPYTKVLSPSDLAAGALEDSGHYQGIGVDLIKDGAAIRITAVRRRGAAAAAGLRPGDAIVAVDGRRLAGASVKALAPRLLGPAGSRVVLDVRRGDRTVRATMRRRVIDTVVVSGRLITGGRRPTGVIAVGDFSAHAAVRVRATASRLVAHGAQALVLDLRENPGGFVDEALAVAGIFLPQRSAVLHEHGLHLAARTLRATGRPLARQVALAVVIDDATASAAEVVTAALRDHHRAVVVGSRSFGKGVIQQTYPLHTGGALQLTVAEYRSPRGAIIQHRGITPDVAVDDKRRTARHDPALLAALRSLP